MRTGRGGRVAGVCVRWAPGLVLLFALLHPGQANALDASVLAGVTDSVDTDETSYSWQLEFRRRLVHPFAASLSWINEGHFHDHHRDGLAAQLWGRIPVLDGKVSFSFGGGAYRYFDTRPQPNGAFYNAHGFAPILSLSVAYYTETPWFVRLTANHIHPAGELDTNSVLLGLGYHLVPQPPETPVRSGGDSPRLTTGSELTPFVGGVIHNNLESRAGIAAGVEYRRGFARNLDWTVSWLNEDNRKGIRRNGLATQLWLVDAFARRRLVLGIGAGMYTFYDRTPPPETHNPVDLAGILTMTAGYRFGGRWIARASWNRVMTDNNRDSDVMVLGIGCRWDE